MIAQAPDIGGMILHHTADSHVVELPFGLPEVHLPTGWYLFGIDVSPTKHVVFMAFAALLVFVTMWLAGRAIRRRHVEGKGPRGFGAAIEALVLFVRNDVAIANIGHGGERFAPYILTLFFFILYCNLLGLLPWGATATGNVPYRAARTSAASRNRPKGGPKNAPELRLAFDICGEVATIGLRAIVRGWHSGRSKGRC